MIILLLLGVIYIIGRCFIIPFLKVFAILIGIIMLYYNVFAKHFETQSFNWEYSNELHQPN